MRSFLNEALEYNRAGLKVIKFTQMGLDVAWTKEWSTYREGQTPDQVKIILEKQGDGIAMLCVDGIEVVDIDTKHDPTGMIAEQLAAMIEEYGFDIPHVLQKTRSGGLHIIYRCPNPEGPKKIAIRAGQKEAMIETKAAVCRLGPQEGIKIRYEDSDNSLLIDPVIPGKIFVTPSLPDRPGFNVGRLKIRRDDGNLTVFFMPEKGPQEWREWRPNELENI